METVTIPNLCPNVRVQIDGKAYRIFSIKYKHPSEPSEDAWVLFKNTTEIPILVDKDTLAMLSGKEITWLYKDKSMVNTEPTIVACEVKMVKD